MAINQFIKAASHGSDPLEQRINNERTTLVRSRRGDQVGNQSSYQAEYRGAEANDRKGDDTITEKVHINFDNR